MKKIKIAETGKIVYAPSVQTSTDGYIDNPSKIDIYDEMMDARKDWSKGEDEAGVQIISQDEYKWWSDYANDVQATYDAVENADLTCAERDEYNTECYNLACDIEDRPAAERGILETIVSARD